jgi:hypothetical protein
LAAAIYYLFRKEQKSLKKAKEAMSPPHPVQSALPSPDERISSAKPAEGYISSRASEAPAFVTLQRRPWLLTDLLRALLIVLSLAVAGGFILVLLPQPTVDRIVKNLQARHEIAQQEQIAFLYLGDETADNEFHVRGVVRNITALPIEQLDAIVRFYAHDRSLLETTIVRMNKETIDPDGVAQFELVHPNYRLEFGSYSVEFKLRQGSLVPYKDMRATPVSP